MDFMCLGDVSKRPRESGRTLLIITCQSFAVDEKQKIQKKSLFEARAHFTNQNKEANQRQDGLDRLYRTAGSVPKCGNWVVTRSGSASDSLRQWPGWQQGLLDVKIFGKTSTLLAKHQARGAFLTIDLDIEQLTRLECWFSHVHPELLLSLQQLIHFVASSYWTPKLFNRGRTPEMHTPSTIFVGRPLWSVFYFWQSHGALIAWPPTGVRMSQEVSLWMFMTMTLSSLMNFGIILSWLTRHLGVLPPSQCPPGSLHF